MLYVFHGTDTSKVADQANAYIAQLRTELLEPQEFVFEGEIVDVGPLDELVEARGLFSEKHLVVLHGTCEKAESRELVFERIDRFALSENIFVIKEGSLHVAHKKRFAQHAHKVEEFARAEQAKRGFDEHGLVAALKSRNRRAIWEAYLRARRAGETPEALAGLLHWGVKDMLARAVSYSKVYQKERLIALSSSLISCYHDAHRGLCDLDVALEHWVLSI